MAIDMHSHWIPSGLLDEMRRRDSAPSIKPDETGVEFIIQPRGKFKLPSDYGDIEKRLAVMDACGVEAAALSISGVFGVECLAVEESHAICRQFSNEVSQMHLAYPQRIFGLATLPIGDMNLAVQEFDRVMQLPGILGCLIPGNAFLTLERALAFRPILEVAQTYKAHILVHTGYLPGDDNMPIDDSRVDNGRQRRVALDMQSRISSNMVTLCMTDILDGYPDVTVQCHNLGGNLPMEIERMDHISLDRFPDEEPPSVKIKKARVLVDCNSMGERGIERAVEVYGAERVIFGSDGTRFGADWSQKAISAARLSEDERAAIRSGNARQLLQKQLS